MGAGDDLLAEIVVAKLGSGVQLPGQIQGTSLLVVARLRPSHLLTVYKLVRKAQAYKALEHSGPINKATTLPIRTRGTVPGSSMGFRHLTRPSV